MDRGVFICAVGGLALIGAIAASAQEQRFEMPRRVERETTIDGRPLLRIERMAATIEASAAAKKPKTVKVNCTKGQSIAAALQDKADQLIIEISGVCKENFQVRRSNVTFRGSDPNFDGIQGVVADPQPASAVELDDADYVRFENLKVERSPMRGITLFNSYAEFANCYFLDNQDTGLHVSISSDALVDNVTFSGNKHGLKIYRNAIVKCSRCDFSDNRWGADLLFYGYLSCDLCSFTGNGEYAVSARIASFARLTNSTVTGNGVFANDGATVDVYDSVITVTDPENQLAAQACDCGSVHLTCVTMSGSISAEQGSQVELLGVTQAAGASNWINSGSLFTVGAWSEELPDIQSTLGSTSVDEFGTALLRDATTVNGSFTCSAGGDAHASSGTNVSGGMSGCAHWSP